MDWITVTGIMASVCTALASLPQLVKIIRLKKARDISLVMAVTLIAGLGLWVAYGILKNDLIIVVANSIPCISYSLIVFFSLRYRKAGNDFR